MKPIEKAQELIDRVNMPIFPNGIFNMTMYQRKQCALICVDEILELIKSMPSIIGTHYKNYWVEVKNEIINL